METKNRTDVQSEAVESLLKSKKSGVAVSMGVGKTLIGLKHLDTLAPAKVLVVYLDECHNLLPSHEPWLDKFQGKIIGLTGTPPKFERSTKGKLVNKFCPIRYSYFVDDAVSDGILNDYKIVVHMLKLGTAKNIMAGGKTRKWPTSELESYSYWCDRIERSQMHFIC